MNRSSPMRRARPARGRPSIDKSVLQFGIAQRMEDPAYQRSAAGRNCMVCEAAGVVAPEGSVVLAHINLIETGAGRGRKADDCDSVFLCTAHHTDMDTAPDRCRWLVINVLLPIQRAAYRKWKGIPR